MAGGELTKSTYFTCEYFDIANACLFANAFLTFTSIYLLIQAYEYCIPFLQILIGALAFGLRLKLPFQT